MNSRFLVFCRAIALSVALVGAMSGVLRAEGQAMVLPVDPVPLIAETKNGEVSFHIEVADDDMERSAGLMFRNFLPEDRGMLFVFPQQRQVGFWMKNTPLPLDLVFIDDQGVVQGVRPGEPFSEAAITPGVPVQYVLELKRGTANRMGIVEGTEIRHPVIDKP